MPEFLDHSLPPSLLLVSGPSGYGKTTFVFKYLLNRMQPQARNPNPAACVFIYDWKVEAERRLGIPAVTTEHGCLTALRNRLVIFNPNPMFDARSRVRSPDGELVVNDDVAGLRWFFQWARAQCRTGPGKKILLVDEINKFTSKFSVPFEILSALKASRVEGLEIIFTAHFPREFHADIFGLHTELVCFRADVAGEFERIGGVYAGAERLATLARGEFTAFQKDPRSEMRGRVF